MYGHGNYDMVIDLCLAVVDENLDRNSVGDPPASKEHSPLFVYNNLLAIAELSAREPP